MLKAFRRLRLYFLLLLAISITVVAVMGPALAPKDPYSIDLLNTFHPPDRENLLGTDRLGRDLFSRILHGARDSFALTMLMVLAISCIGSVIGMVAGYIGGAIDMAIMQAADILLAFPAMVFAIAVAGIFGRGIYRTLLALALVCWAKYARMARGLVDEIRRREYVTQALFGGSRWYQILFKYIMPNILPQIVIVTVSDIGEMMITLSSLSFLGLIGNVPEPEWGIMLAEYRQFITTRPYLVLYTGLALLITVVVFNLLGDSLRDVLDPKELRN